MELATLVAVPFAASFNELICVWRSAIDALSPVTALSICVVIAAASPLVAEATPGVADVICPVSIFMRLGIHWSAVLSGPVWAGEAMPRIDLIVFAIPVTAVVIPGIPLVSAVAKPLTRFVPQVPAVVMRPVAQVVMLVRRSASGFWI